MAMKTAGTFPHVEAALDTVVQVDFWSSLVVGWDQVQMQGPALVYLLGMFYVHSLKMTTRMNRPGSFSCILHIPGAL